MKKRISLLLCLVLTLLVVGCSETTHSGFVSEGKNYSAQVTDNKLVLTLKKDTTTETWKIENNPVLFSIDNFIEYDDFVELNITALNNGLDTIVLYHILDDGSYNSYSLTLEISKQLMSRFLISSISFININ